MTGTRFSRRTLLKLGGAAALSALMPGCGSPEDTPRAFTFDPSRPFERLDHNPVIAAGSASVGDNVNGPSLIRVPDWIENPLGRYYLYFAHHAGSYIRMAYADDLAGPWTIHAPGTLQLSHTPCYSHIASPDVVIDHARRAIRMYFHGDVFDYFGLENITAEEFARLPGFMRSRLVQTGGPTPDGLDAEFPIVSYQRTFAAESLNGITFSMVHDDPLGAPYFRVFDSGGATYALGMPGIMYRSPDGLRDFARGPVLFPDSMRHSAVLRSGETLHVFWTRVGDAPERILRSAVDLTPDWMQWRAGEAVTVLQPETAYEGADLPVAPSERGRIENPARQLRDPAIYVEGEQVYLLYAVAGEQGIAIARQAG